MVIVTSHEARPLKFAQHVPNLQKYCILRNVNDITPLVVIHSKGLLLFTIITELQISSGPGPSVRLSCLDTLIAIVPLFKHFDSVFINVYTLG